MLVEDFEELLTNVCGDISGKRRVKPSYIAFAVSVSGSLRLRLAFIV